jgi:hypothetical protein
MNELTVNLAAQRIDDGYLKVLVVAQAAVAEVLSKLFAVPDGLQVAFEVNPDPVSHRNAILHVEKELLHGLASNRFNIGGSSTLSATVEKGFPGFRAPWPEWW